MTVQDMFEAVGQHQSGHHVRRGAATLERWRARLRVLVVVSLPPTRWLACPKRLALRCSIPLARLRRTKAVTNMAWPLARQ